MCSVFFFYETNLLIWGGRSAGGRVGKWEGWGCIGPGKVAEKKGSGRGEDIHLQRVDGR